jgi:hypothetical protein
MTGAFVLWMFVQNITGSRFGGTVVQTQAPSAMSFHVAVDDCTRAEIALHATMKEKQPDVKYFTLCLPSA